MSNRLRDPGATSHNARSEARQLETRCEDDGQRGLLNFRDPDLAGQFAANGENRMSRNSPPLPRRGVFASYRFILS